MTELASTDNDIGLHLTQKSARDAVLQTDNGMAGRVYTDEDTGENVYVTFKRRENMFVKASSHAMSVSILATLRDRWNVSKVYIFEDSGTLYVQSLKTYENADEVNFSGYDRQKIPPVTNCIDSYEGVANSVERYADEIRL